MDLVNKLPFVLFYATGTFFIVKFFVRRNRTNARFADRIALIGSLVVAIVSALVHLPVEKSLAVSAPSPLHPVHAARDMTVFCSTVVLPNRSTAMGKIDEVLNATNVPLAANAIVASGAFVRITGWATDRSGHREAQGVCLALDGVVDRNASVAFGATRRDVSLILKDLSVIDAGFNATVPLRSLASGHHTIEMVVVSQDGSVDAINDKREFVRP